jgi:CRISPR type I-E-associated protein CasB/Cse2
MKTDPGQDSRNGGEWTYEQKILGIAGTVQDRGKGGGMSRGERAELRRMGDRNLFPPEPFWRIVGRYEIPPSEEPFWRAVIPLMVMHPHNSGVRAGAALAEAGVSSSRIERWLRYDPSRAREEARRLLARLDAGLDWVRFARLLRWWTDSDRRRFARDFFLSPAYREREKETEGKETKE